MLFLSSILLAVTPTPVATAPTADKTIVETAVAAGSFTTLATALEAADLVGALSGEGPFTVFAPTDEAFAKLPAGTVAELIKPENKAKLQAILLYHVTPGSVPAKSVVELPRVETLNGQSATIEVAEQGVLLDGAKVIKTDIRCSNGIIHVIDTVLLPNTNDIVATAKGAGSFGTLLAAAQAAGIAEALMGDGPFTVFAPTDEAFAALPAGTVESLLEPGNKDKLAAILKYHVVPGRVFGDQALKAGSAETLQGQDVEFTKTDAGISVNGANVVESDIQATNGVIHVIDAVILPPARPGSDSAVKPVSAAKRSSCGSSKRVL